MPPLRPLVFIVVGFVFLIAPWHVGQLDILFDPLGYALVLAGAFGLPRDRWTRLARWMAPLTGLGVAVQPRWAGTWHFWTALALSAAGGAAVALALVSARAGRLRSQVGKGSRPTSPQRPPRTVPAPLFAVIVLTVLLNGFGLWWLLPNLEECYSDPLVKTLNFIQGVLPDPQWNNYTYPPMQHRIVGAALVTADEFFRLVNYRPPKVIAWSWSFGIARGVSALMGVVMVAFLYRLIRNLSGSARAAAFVALAVATNVEILFRAHTSNVDMGYLMWLAMALWMAGRILADDQLTDWIWLGLLGGLVVTTKDQGGAALVGVAAVVLVAGWRHARREKGLPTPFSAALLRLGQRAALALLAFAFTFVYVYELTTDTTMFREHLAAVRGHAVVPFYEVPATLRGYAHLALLTARRLAEFSSWPLAALMVFGLGLAVIHRPTRRRVLWLAAPVATYFVFALCFARQAPARQVLPIFIVLACFAGCGADFLLNAKREAPARRRGARFRNLALRTLHLALGLLAALLLWRAVVTDLLFDHESRDEATAWLLDHLRPSDRLAVFKYLTYQPSLPADLHALLVAQPSEAALREKDCNYVLLVEQLIAQDLYVERTDPVQPPADGRHWRRKNDEDAPRLYERLLNGDLGYHQVARFKVRLPLDPDCVFGLNPEVIILKRTAPAADSRPVAEAPR